MRKRSAFLREAERFGWRFARITGSGHMELRHPKLATPAIVASTPGGRGEANERALLKRLLKRAEVGHEA